MSLKRRLIKSRLTPAQIKTMNTEELIRGEHMFTYLQEPDVPRSGNSENFINWLDPGKVQVWF
ncbi:hypothetical protein CEE35_02380 [Candidatus Aerophobetes bacterium Ae_b3b]|nr:MAG: hypothetical protein CEE35_02380 [Candidatus Aerophobetes bacterium Ae_b3b]